MLAGELTHPYCLTEKRLLTPSEIMARTARNTPDRAITKTEDYWRAQHDRAYLQHMINKSQGL